MLLLWHQGLAFMAGNVSQTGIVSQTERRQTAPNNADLLNESNAFTKYHLKRIF